MHHPPGTPNQRACLSVLHELTSWVPGTLLLPFVELCLSLSFSSLPFTGLSQAMKSDSRFAESGKADGQYSSRISIDSRVLVDEFRESWSMQQM